MTKNTLELNLRHLIIVIAGANKRTWTAKEENDIIKEAQRAILVDLLEIVGEYHPQKNKWGKITQQMAADNMIRKVMIEHIRKALTEYAGGEKQSK